MSTVVGATGIQGFPSLQSICDLYRSIINDTFSGGDGEINTDDAPWMRPFLNSAIRDLYAELRITGDMRVIVDDVIISALTPVNAANPAAQTALTYTGYFNGTTWNNNLRLPSDLMWVMKLWQTPSGSGAPFMPIHPAPSGLEGVYQGSAFTHYEVRGQNEVWFNGALLPVDLRIRYQAVFPDIADETVDFDNTYVPIQDSTNAIAHKMIANYAQRLSPDQFALADSRAKEFVSKLKSESILNSQAKQFARETF